MTETDSARGPSLAGAIARLRAMIAQARTWRADRGDRAAVYACASAVNLILCLVLIRRFGLFGAAGATAMLAGSALLYVAVRLRLGRRAFVPGVSKA